MSGNVSVLLADGRRYYHTFRYVCEISIDISLSLLSERKRSRLLTENGRQDNAPLVTPPIDFTETVKNASVYPLLVGLRVNTDLLTALANVTSQLYVEQGDTLTLLDSNVTYKITLAPPEIRGRCSLGGARCRSQRRGSSQ